MVALLEIEPAEVDGASERALDVLEGGGIVSLPHVGFQLRPEEQALLGAVAPSGARKNISFDVRSERLSGVSAANSHAAVTAAMMRRFSQDAAALVGRLFPDYAATLQRGRVSFRPVPVEGRRMSARKDDRRLHVDAFQSSPVQDRRILRVFANIDPQGRPRVWEVGEPFEPFARRFLPRLRLHPAAARSVMHRVGLTRGRRTAYDDAMLQLHDQAKLDPAYQSEAPHQRLEFASGTMWLVFTDAVLHAALAGQYALEQTFLVPVAAMRRPERAPLRILEQLTGRPLT